METADERRDTVQCSCLIIREYDSYITTTVLVRVVSALRATDGERREEGTPDGGMLIIISSELFAKS